MPLDTDKCVIFITLEHKGDTKRLFYSGGFSPYDRRSDLDDPYVLLEDHNAHSNWTFDMIKATNWNSNRIEGTITRLTNILIDTLGPKSQFSIYGYNTYITLGNFVAGKHIR